MSAIIISSKSEPDDTRMIMRFSTLLILNENFINETRNELIGDIMAGLGRLLSPLPLSELTLSMIRKLKESYNLNQQVEDALGKSQLGRFFAPFEKELIRMEKVAEQTKVAIVRMQGSLKSVEANLNSYRRKLKKMSKKDPSAKDQMKYVESMLTQVRKLKNNIMDESRRAIREESWILHNV